MIGLIYILGLISGGAFGILFMCLLQINRKEVKK